MNLRKAATAARAAGAVALAAALAPATVAVALFLVATAVCCLGVRLMWGDGWALLAGAANLYVLAFALARGVMRG